MTLMEMVEADPELSIAPKTKASPATQMREMLVKSRRVGLAFDRARDVAFKRVRWPHDTEHRIDWKDRLETDRPVWRAAYERTGHPSRKMRAVYTLLTELDEENERAA